ncbi:hypothetical protein [Candidatus Thiosymbion oneisti]|uniref:hypothetical protein n=1 Tax=Candidatus Thiosymbion oneisti TaxID=589554 RepID=UPI00105DD7F0|nr:hypothetical protein [Candidatus Thiosymbion oneisti]
MKFIKKFYGPITSVFGIILSILSGFSHKGWSLLVFSLVTTIAFSIIFFLADRIFSLKKYTFFGCKNGTKMTLIIPSYWNRVDYNPQREESKHRYYKENNGKKTWLIGATTYPLTSTGGASLACKFSALISCKVTNNIEIKGDEEDLRNLEGAIFCIGSPTSNILSGKVLNTLPQNRAINFTTTTMKCWLRDEPYVADTQFDYAILARIRYQSDLYFICAGIDEEGSVAVGQRLISKWRSMPSYNFIIIYRVEKNTYKIEECTKILQKNEEWVNY